MEVQPYEWYNRRELEGAPFYKTIQFQEVTLFREESRENIFYLGASILGLIERERFVDPLLVAHASCSSFSEFLGIAEEEDLLQTVHVNGNGYELITAEDVWRIRRRMDMPGFVVDKYIDTVEHVARIVRNGVHKGIVTLTHNDHVAAGLDGLMDAYTKYELPKQVDRTDSFIAYAKTRIRGAMIDHGRQLARIPRSEREAARNYDDVHEKLSSRHARDPTDEEMIKELGWSRGKYRKFVQNTPQRTTLFIDAMGESEHDLFEDIFDSGRYKGADVVVMENELADILHSLVGRLNEQQREVFVLRYIEGLTLKEIGNRMDISESRTCQIDSLVKERIGTMLVAEYPEYVVGFDHSLIV